MKAPVCVRPGKREARPRSPLPETVMEDMIRARELKTIAGRMGVIVSVFQVRCESLGNPGFRAFQELMDAYISCCHATLAKGRDFTREELEIPDEAKPAIRAAFTKIFGKEPQELA
jgi:hypothetical protein